MPAKLGHVVEASVVRGWRCDEASGALVDAAGGSDLPVLGGAVGVTAGQVDGARYFDGTGHFTNLGGSAQASDLSLMATGKFTVAGWLKPLGSIFAASSYRVIYTAGLFTTTRFTGCVAYLGVNTSLRTLRIAYETGTPGSGTPTTNLGFADALWALPLDERVYVTATFDGATGKGTFYVNGQLGNVVTGLPAPSLGLTSSFQVVGGNPVADERWAGDLDEVFAWNRALSAAEVLENYHRAVGTPGFGTHRAYRTSPHTVRYWGCDEAPGSPGAHVGALVDGAGGSTIPCNSVRTGGQLGGAMLFAYGTGDAPCVQSTPTAADRTRLLPGNISSAGWAFINTTDAAADTLFAWCTLLCFSNPGTYVGALLRVAVHRTDWTLHLGYESGTPGAGVITEVVGPVVPRNTPFHWAIARTNGVCDLYLNGVLMNSFTGQPLPSGGQAGSTWVIGSYENGTFDRHWGWQDEIIVEDRYWSADDVSALYQDGIGYPLPVVLPTTTRLLPSTLPATDLLWDNVNGRLARASNGDFVLSRGLEAVRQDVQFALEVIKGEYFLDTDEGTPWFDGILGKSKTTGAITALLRNRIESRPYIHRVTSMQLQQDVANRVLSVTFSADTDFGDLTDQVVSTFLG